MGSAPDGRPAIPGVPWDARFLHLWPQPLPSLPSLLDEVLPPAPVSAPGRLWAPPLRQSQPQLPGQPLLPLCCPSPRPCLAHSGPKAQTSGSTGGSSVPGWQGPRCKGQLRSRGHPVQGPDLRPLASCPPAPHCPGDRGFLHASLPAPPPPAPRCPHHLLSPAPRPVELGCHPSPIYK